MKTVVPHQISDVQPVSELKQCYYSILSKATEQGIICLQPETSKSYWIVTTKYHNYMNFLYYFFWNNI